MTDELEGLIAQRNVLTYRNSSVLICKVKDQNDGFDLASNILSKIIDKKSVLYLSGGRTPKELYSKLVQEERLIPGAVGMVDERYGERFHENSNERMIRDTGFLRYLEMMDIPFYPILQAGLNREEIAREYDAKLRSFQSAFTKHIGILGIGEDGHTAGLPAVDQRSKIKDQKEGTSLVKTIDNFPGQFRVRITMSFMGLAMMDILLVLVFGAAKKKALELVFQDGSEEGIPGRFYKRPEIAKKTLLITDQEV